MATVIELKDSGVGDSISDRGSVSVSRLFGVTVDSPATGQPQDPADFVLRSRTLVTTGTHIPLGSPHPLAAKDRAGLVAATYTIEEHPGPLDWIVRVGYAPPATFDFSPKIPWLFSYSPGFGTRVATEIRTTTDPRTGVPLDTAKTEAIGPLVYHPDDEGRFLATFPGTEETNGEPTLIKLRVDPKDKRRIQGKDVTFPIGTMTLSRQLKSYTEGLHDFLMNHRNMTNTFRFLTRDRGRLKFVGPEVSSSPAPTESSSAGTSFRKGKRTVGLVWNVTLHFEDTNDVFEFPVNGRLRTYDFAIQDTLEQGGVTVPIEDTQSSNPFPPNAIQISYYKYYFDYPFENILGVLNSYA